MTDDRTQRVIWAAGAALIALPAVVLGFGAPVWLGVLLALVAALAVLLMAPIGPIRRAPRTPALKAVLRDAEPALVKLAELEQGRLRGPPEAIAASARRMIAEVRAEPGRLAAVQRMLAHYLPKAAEIAALHAALGDEPAHAARRAEIEALLTRLAQAFRDAEGALDAQDLRVIDTELKLMRDSLDEDFAR
jgi:hypothetical protein